MSKDHSTASESAPEQSSEGLNRRQMVAFTVAGPMLSVGLSLNPDAACAQVSGLPSLGLPNPVSLLSTPLPLTPPDITDYFDVADSINRPSLLTMPLVTVDLPTEGPVVARMRLPRLDQGCGINTAVAIMLADELGLKLEQVDVVLEDARNELGPNQITGGSANVRAFKAGIPLIVGVLNYKLTMAAAQSLGVPVSTVRLLPGGLVGGPSGVKIPFSQLSARAAKVPTAGLRLAPNRTKLASTLMAGATAAPIPRIESLDIVTGRKRFTLDQQQQDWPGSPKLAADKMAKNSMLAGQKGKGALDIAKPAIVLMAKRINQKLKRFDANAALNAIKGKGVLAVVPPPPPRVDAIADSNAVIVPYPPAIVVVAETFGEAWDGALALQESGLYEWDDATSSLPAGTRNNKEIDAALSNLLAPLEMAKQTVTSLAGLKTVSGEFTYPPAVAASLEVECAIVDAGVVKENGLEIWAGLQSPQATVNAVALDLGIPPLPGNVVAHVIPSGGSFGRRLFWDPVQVAAHASQQTGYVIKLMYHRSDDVRHTRGRPQQRHHLKAHIFNGRVTAYDHLATSPRLDTRHGYGDFSTMLAVSPPLGITQNGPAHLAVEQFFFKTMVSSPYNWGVQTKELLPAPIVMNTVSYRSVHIQPFRSTEEMLVDEIAKAMGSDPYSFRMKYLRQERAKKVLEHVVKASGWLGYPHKANEKLKRALGLAVHQEAKSFTAAVVEIDASDTTKGVLYRGAKVLRAWIAVDVGDPINHSGLKAQFEGGLAESISLVLDAGLSFEDGLPQEFSYNNYRIARMKTFPKMVDIHIMPAIPGAEIGGAGEVGMSATSGAIGNAWRRATGDDPRHFPLNGRTDFSKLDKTVAAGKLPPKPSTFK